MNRPTRNTPTNLLRASDLTAAPACASTKAPTDLAGTPLDLEARREDAGVIPGPFDTVEDEHDPVSAEEEGVPIENLRKAVGYINREIENLRKAAWYINREIERRGGEL